MNYGLHKTMPYDEYAALDAVRSSTLKHFRRSAAHARYEMLNPEDTAAKVLGQAVHIAVLEPQRFADEYAVAPKLDRRTTAGKAEWSAFCAENAGKIVLKADELELCRALADAAQAHPIAAKLLDAPGLTEPSLVWEDAETKLACKARLDRLTTHDGFSTIVDVKTTRDASPRGFARECATYSYHMQAAWYLRGADALSPVARRFVFIAIEKDPPYAVGVYELDNAFLGAGQKACDDALRMYRNAVETGEWPGYSTSIRTIFAPPWLADMPEETPE